MGSEGAIHYYSAGMQDIEWEVKVPYTTTVRAGMQDIEWEVKVPYTTIVQGCMTLSGE